MRILALEPYYGGSHRAFLDGWREHSRHAWHVLTLPAHHWKWRMRHAAATFADRLAGGVCGPFDCILCSDMLNLPEFLGLAPEPLRGLPAVAYFHENQLTYPVAHPDHRDLHFSLTNVMTALAAGEVWFNSAYHRREFLQAAERMLRQIPGGLGFDAPGRITGRSAVHPPGIDRPPERPPRRPGPLRILWAARWEHDKGPETFFRAVENLARRGADFRLSVIGEQFRDRPAVFDEARRKLADRIDRWGYESTREGYHTALCEADVFVSTAEHEFFGLSTVEAVAAGACPLLPRRLAYPEVLDVAGHPEREAFFYDGTVSGLTDRLGALADRAEDGPIQADLPPLGPAAVAHLFWENLAPRLDDALAAATRPRNG